MSPRSDLQTNDDRRLAAERPPPDDSLRAAVGRWLWASGYQGLAQVGLLGAPIFWLVFRSPRSRGILKPTALVLFVVTPLVVGAVREGLVAAGRPWPTITSDSLSFAGGYRAVFRRGILLNHVLGLAAYGGAAAGLLAGSLPVALAVALPLVVGGVAAVPWLTPETPRAAAGRLAYAAVALSLAAVVGAPLSGDPRFRTAPAAFAVLVCWTLLDLRPWRVRCALGR
jgi:hypothetical protein